MKFIVIVMLTGLIGTGTFAQSTFVLNGDLSGIKAPVERVYLNYVVNNQRLRDSADVKDDHYHFSGNLAEPVLATLTLRYRADRVTAVTPANGRRDNAKVFLEPGTITASSVDSFSNISVTGSKADIEFRKLQEQARPYDEQATALYKRLAAARKFQDQALAQQLEKQIDSLDAAANENVYATYVRNNPRSPVALFAFRNWAGYAIDAVAAEPLFNALPADVRNLPSGKEMQEKIDIAKKTAIGQTAIDFTQNDTLDRPVALKSFRGKYVLVDFWASWCGPCRADNPNLVKTYQKYSLKGFQILSISLDKPGAKEKWLNAIHDDHLNWNHVSDLQFWNNAVAREYGIEAIPQNLLLDPDGKIIGKNLHGDELEKKLAGLYSN